MGEINQINELLMMKILTENEKKSEPTQCYYFCHTRCSYCPPKLHECSCSLTILVDITKWETPPRLYFENKFLNLKGWITLKDNLNFFCWCCFFDSDTYLAKNKAYFYKERAFFQNFSKTVIYPSEDTRCISINILNYKKCQKLKEIGFWYENLSQSRNSKKSHQITHVNVLCKSNEPPSLFNICKIAYLTKFMQGKINEEYLPCLFNVSKKKVPSHLNLNSITMKHLTPCI